MKKNINHAIKQLKRTAIYVLPMRVLAAQNSPAVCYRHMQLLLIVGHALLVSFISCFVRMNDVAVTCLRGHDATR
jgi:hypothetical protein